MLHCGVVLTVLRSGIQHYNDAVITIETYGFAEGLNKRRSYLLVGVWYLINFGDIVTSVP